MKQITLSENVMVSDPCYTPDTWCQTKLDNVLPGLYNVEVEKSNQGDWGTRVSSITVIHEDYEDMEHWGWEQHSECGVDSGQCGIFCMTSYRNDEMSESITTPDSDFVLPYNDSEGDKWYEKMCKFTLDKQQWGVYDTGVVSSSGIGDGLYPLEVMMDKEKIVGMRITYLGNSDEELLDEGDCCGVCGNDLEDGESCNCINE